MERVVYLPNKTLWKAVAVHGNYSLHPAVTIDEELRLNYESFALVNQTTGEVSEVDFLAILLAEFFSKDENASFEVARELPEHTHPYMPRMDEGWLKKFDEAFKAMAKRLGWKLVYTEFEA